MTAFSWLDLLLGLTLLSTGVYIYYIYRYRSGFRKPLPEYSNEKPTVSVVVAARNEGAKIGTLLTGLVNQSYPTELYEVVVANDGSADNTEQVVLDFAAKFPFIRVFSVQGREKVRSPKKNALQQAIDIAHGELILTTDADCMVSQYWIESMVAHFRPGIDMVVGYSRTYLPDWKKAKFVQRFEHFDVFALFTAGAGAALLGQPVAGTGQNLAYRKSAFIKEGGFKPIERYLSGDDIHMIQRFRRLKFGVDYARNRHTFVYTRPIANWVRFLNQRARWTSNTKAMLRVCPPFFFYLAAVLFMTVGPIVLLFFRWQTALLLLALKALTEYRWFQTVHEEFMLDRERLHFYFWWFLVDPFYMAFVVFTGVFGLFRWRGRTPPPLA